MRITSGSSASPAQTNVNTISNNLSRSCSQAPPRIQRSSAKIFTRRIISAAISHEEHRTHRRPRRLFLGLIFSCSLPACCEADVQCDCRAARALRGPYRTVTHGLGAQKKKARRENAALCATRKTNTWDDFCCTKGPQTLRCWEDFLNG